MKLTAIYDVYVTWRGEAQMIGRYAVIDGYNRDIWEKMERQLRETHGPKLNVVCVELRERL